MDLEQTVQGCPSKVRGFRGFRGFPGRWSLIGLILMTVFFSSGCSLTYLAHLGKGQARILFGKKTVEELLQSDKLPSPLRERSCSYRR